MICLSKPVQVSYDTAQPAHFLNDVVGRALRGLQAVAQRRCLQIYHTQRRIQLMGDIVDQPPAEVALGFQGRGHPVEGYAHPPQLIRGRDWQLGPLPLGNCLGCLGQSRHGGRNTFGQPDGQQYGDPDRQHPADQGR